MSCWTRWVCPGSLENTFPYCTNSSARSCCCSEVSSSALWTWSFSYIPVERSEKALSVRTSFTQHFNRFRIGALTRLLFFGHGGHLSNLPLGRGHYGTFQGLDHFSGGLGGSHPYCFIFSTEDPPEMISGYPLTDLSCHDLFWL